MPVTLAQASLNANDAIDRFVIDEFRKSSYLLDNMQFDDVVSPGTGGGTLVYGYTRLVTQPTAAFRAINSEYTPQEVTKQPFTASLKPFGGSYQIDRVLAAIARAAEVRLQQQQKVKAARSLFHHAFINGDSAVDANSFDGLDKALTGSTTEVDASSVDWTTANSQSSAITALRQMRRLIAVMDERPSAFLMNSDAFAMLETLGDYVSQLNTMAAFGQSVTTWRGIPLVDLGDRPGSTDPIIATDGATGRTDIYAVRFGMDALHGASLAGQPLVRQWLPDFSTAGAVKTGEAEIVAAIALRRTKAAAVLRDIKVV
jgi:hypothetical protein